MLHKCFDSQPQSEQPDKTACLILPVNVVFFKGGKAGLVERALRLAPDHLAVSLVELKTRGSPDTLLREVHHMLEIAHLRRIPEPVVDHARVFRNKAVTQMDDFSVHRNGFHRLVGNSHDSTARSFVNALAISSR